MVRSERDFSHALQLKHRNSSDVQRSGEPLFFVALQLG